MNLRDGAQNHFLGHRRSIGIVRVLWRIVAPDSFYRDICTEKKGRKEGNDARKRGKWRAGLCISLVYKPGTREPKLTVRLPTAVSRPATCRGALRWIFPPEFIYNRINILAFSSFNGTFPSLSLSPSPLPPIPSSIPFFAYQLSFAVK